MNRTGIEWTDYTWNPITGCTNGCPYCYARRMAYRLKGRAGYPEDDPFRPTFHPDRLLEPLEIQKPSKIFTVSMGDLFDPHVPPIWQDLIYHVMRECPQHIFQILTKQTGNIRLEWPIPEGLWLGVSLDCRRPIDLELSYLRSFDVPVRFVSFEPLLGMPRGNLLLSDIDWVIIGAQTGPKAQQPRKEWLEPILHEAVEHDIPIFIKDNLDWTGPRPREFPKMEAIA